MTRLALKIMKIGELLKIIETSIDAAAGRRTLVNGLQNAEGLPA